MKEVLRSIDGIDLFPVIAIAIFFTFFVLLLIYVMRLKKEEVQHMASIPLEDEPSCPTKHKLNGVAKGIGKALGFLLLISGSMSLQADTTAPGIDEQDLLYTLLFTMIVLGLAALVLAGTILTLVRAKVAERAAATEAATEGETIAETEKIPQPIPGISWSWWKQKLTDAVPVAQEASIDMGHDYDGIRELDNNLPPWWKYGFYFTIGFAMVYLVHFHVVELSFLNGFFGPSNSSTEEYVIAMEEAEIQKKAYLAKQANLVDERTATYMTEASDIAKGKELFTSKTCVVCHGQQGEGGIGPNLTDRYWLHGGDVKDIFATIKYGVPAKGMQAWESQIKPIEMQQISSYILSIQGTNPPNPKDPEGELYVPTENSGEVDSTSVAVVTEGANEKM
ncbi:MAG: cbb3-type cytochrome c oxidase N-terminal domain-containing protein [Bacteroidota bacterium]